VVQKALNLNQIEIKGLAYDSRKVKSGDVFIAIPGARFDGHDFIPKAIENGAVCVVAERDFSSPSGVVKIIVKNARSALAELSARFYGYPSRKLKIIGITGTNGKTTIAYFIESILREAGIKTGLIGTVETRINGRSVPSSMTTPESLELQKMLADMAADGVTHLVMEVSSHALAQERVHGLEFDAAIFTNLTHEHLDFHKTMESYLDSKLKLFRMLKPDGAAIVNIDDSYGKRIAEEVEGEVIFYGIKDVRHELRSTKTSEFDLKLKEYDIKFDRMRVRIDSTEIRTPYVGVYNIYNIMAAFYAGLAMHIDKNTIRKGIEKAAVPGRLERIAGKKGFTVIVDFAHTPDGLQKLLETVKPLAAGKLILVFGCPGDRDREKRPVMGEIAAKLADRVIVTTDDPHTEDPKKIIDEVLSGTTHDALHITHYIDRREAIKEALKLADKGDVVVVAGRGHEKLQDYNGKKVELDDRQTILDLLRIDTK